MNYRNNLPNLGFGCMRLPDSYEESEKLVLKAIEKGVNYFDTAYIYSGKEVLLGKILHSNNMRDKVRIATKIPLFMCKTYDDLDKIFEKQLIRLQTDYIDYYLLHMLNNPAELSGLLAMGLDKWVNKKKEDEKIKHIGFSFHGKGGDFIKLIDGYNWDFCMIQYNYLDIKNQAGLNGLQYAHSKNIPVIIMEPLRGGLLADTKRIPKKAADIFKSETMSPAQYALRWLWNHPEVSCVLSGMKTMWQLEDNIVVAKDSNPNCMSEDELKVIERVTDAFNELKTIPCTGCDYCMPCPAGVNIPGCFSAYNAYCMDKKSFNQYLLNTGATHSKRGTAKGCVGCGQCEPRCPQSIPIQASLKKVGKKMEPLWFRIGMPIVRKYMARKSPENDKTL